MTVVDAAEQAPFLISTDDYMLSITDRTVWFQGNFLFGNMVEGLSDDWRYNRDRAVEIISDYTDARRVVRMKPPKDGTNCVDLGMDLDVPLDPYVETDGIVTADPEKILHANPADCGEIALHGVSPVLGVDVIALVHADRVIAQERSHLDVVRYLADPQQGYGIDTKDMTVHMSPSGRAGYRRVISEAQKQSAAWQRYLKAPQTDGSYHVDFHNMTVDTLVEYGIPREAMTISPIDTTTDPNYYSHSQHMNQGQPMGANGLMFALR